MAQRYGYALRFVPIDLPRAKLAAGNTGPSNRQVPAKLRYLTADMNRWAQRYGVPLRFPKTFASERMNKGTLFAQDRGRAQDYVTAAFSSAWRAAAKTWTTRRCWRNSPANWDGRRRSSWHSSIQARRPNVMKRSIWRRMPAVSSACRPC